ncbi:MAG: MerR family transcriptional regulator [Gordonibacter sp.]|uniref:MerR family transcriptional regulator n=1 Tax=Gordonibacter sp. TaxID=1968902 RepID=UPI002FC82840
MSPRTYTTSEIAEAVGIHPNTVRYYEQTGFITQAERKPNGYRVFTDEHLLQIRLIRLALQVEIVQNNLRHEAIGIIKAMSARNYRQAASLALVRLEHLKRDQKAAGEAVATVHDILAATQRDEDGALITRAAAAKSLYTTIDCLRNWEMNGLFSAKRSQNGYRVYTESDLDRLRIIKILRDAGYSLVAIHRLFAQLDANRRVDIHRTLDTPAPDEDILSVCDKLQTSLALAERHSHEIIELLSCLEEMRANSETPSNETSTEDH